MVANAVTTPKLIVSDVSCLTSTLRGARTFSDVGLFASGMVIAGTTTQVQRPQMSSGVVLRLHGLCRQA